MYYVKINRYTYTEIFIDFSWNIVYLNIIFSNNTLFRVSLFHIIVLFISTCFKVKMFVCLLETYNKYFIKLIFWYKWAWREWYYALTENLAWMNTYVLGPSPEAHFSLPKNACIVKVSGWCWLYKWCITWFPIIQWKLTMWA